MRQEVQVYVTIKLKGLNQRFEESDEGDRQMGSLFIVVITIKYLQLIDMGGLRTTAIVIYSNGSRCKLLTASVCKNKRNKVYVTIKAKGLLNRVS